MGVLFFFRVTNLILAVAYGLTVQVVETTYGR